MKNQIFVLFIIFSVLFLFGCTSMNFVPPKMSLATADYVDKTISKNSKKTAEEVMVKADSIIGEKAADQKQRINTMMKDIENQQKSTAEVLASMEDITKKSESVDYQLQKMVEDIQISKLKTQTNLDRMSDTLTVNITKFSKLVNDNVQTLKAQNQQLTDIINQLQAEMDSMPEKTLEGLQKAIEEFLKEK